MAEGLWTWEGYGLPDRIYQVTFLECAGSFSYPAHRHQNQWELVYVSRGAFRHRLENRVVSHEAGTFILVRDQDLHALSGQNFSFYNLAFPTTVWSTVQNLIDPQRTSRWEILAKSSQPPQLTLQKKERAPFEARLDRLLEMYSPTDFLQLWLELIARLLPSVASKTTGGRWGRVSKDSETESLPIWLEKAVTAARFAPRVPSTHEFILWCGCSPEHVARTIRKAWDTTATDFLNELRLDRAAALIQGTNRPVQGIGQDLGFASPNYFHRKFRARFGMTPREFRRQAPRPHQIEARFLPPR